MKKLITIVLALLLALSLCAVSMAETVHRNPATIDVNRLGGRRVLTDIRASGEGELELTLYETETFAAAAVEGLKAGDTIVSDGVEYRVETVSKPEEGTVILNQGTANELLFVRNPYGEYEHTGDDDIHPQVVLGKIKVKTDELFAYVLDSSDVDRELPEVYDTRKLLENLRADPDAYAMENTYVTFDNYNTPSLITRMYTPWQ